MNIEKSLSDKFWEEKQIDLNHIQRLSQKKSISEIFSKLLISRGVFEENYDNFINPNLLNNLPDPFELKDMKKGIDRCIEALKNKEKIGIIADYDVDGSTSASILFRFLNNFTNNIVCKIPSRLSEGYGPNIRIMNEMLKDNIKLLFTLDCGTSAFNSIDLPNYNKIEVIDLKLGMEVEHARFGKGIVEKIEGKGIDRKAIINFNMHGAKNLLLRFAKLKVL